jgi:hypothetical protein
LHFAARTGFNETLGDCLQSRANKPRISTASTPDQSVASDLDFGKMGVAKSAILLVPQGSSTRVTWRLDVDMGVSPVGRYFGLMMDHMIGKDYQTGLSKLKPLVESMPNVDIAGFAADPVVLTAKPILVVAETSPLDTPSISKAYADGYAQIGKFMAKNKLHPSGAPLGIDGEMTSTTYTFQAGMPIDRADVTATDSVRFTQSYAGKALKTTHTGPYDTLAKTRSLSARARESGAAEQMLGRAADAILLHRGREFETHSHRFRDLGGPAEFISHDLAVADRGEVIGVGERTRQRRSVGHEIEHARLVAHRRFDRDIPLALNHPVASSGASERPWTPPGRACNKAARARRRNGQKSIWPMPPPWRSSTVPSW